MGRPHARAKAALLARLLGQPTVKVPAWTRAELYERDADVSNDDDRPDDIDASTTRTYVSHGGAPMRMTATELRGQLYSVLDRVAETGETVEIVRKGKTLRISAAEDQPLTFSMDRLVAHPGTIIGDPDELVHLDWSREWMPFEDDD